MKKSDILSKDNNKGFSLVELIIVIAIMAILVGVMAPQLLKYIEKTNISSDTQLCDTVLTALTMTLTDPEIVTSNDASVKTIIDSFENSYSDYGGHGLVIESGRFSSTLLSCDVFTNMSEILGFDITDPAVVREHMRSTPAKTSGVICISNRRDGSNDYVVWIAHSDNTGGKQDYNEDVDNLQYCIHVE